jgi:hypothetical protein
MGDGGFGQPLKRRVVIDIAIPHQSAMPMAGVFTVTNVCYD